MAKSVSKTSNRKKISPELVYQKAVANGGNIEKAVRDSGLSEKYARSGKFQKTKGWQELMNKYISEEKLMKVHSEGLEAGKKIFKNNNSTGEIEEVAFEPDFAVRHKYLETGLKIRGKLKDPEGNKTQNNIFIFNDEAKEKAQGLVGNYLSNTGDDTNSS